MNDFVRVFAKRFSPYEFQCCLFSGRSLLDHVLVKGKVIYDDKQNVRVLLNLGCLLVEVLCFFLHLLSVLIIDGWVRSNSEREGDNGYQSSRYS